MLPSGFTYFNLPLHYRNNPFSLKANNANEANSKWGSVKGMNLDKLLTSGCRQKILKTLQKEKSINIMGLVTKINSTYIEVNRNVKILEREGIVSERRFGRIRMIILNQEDPKTKVLLQALKILNNQEKPVIPRKCNAENLQKSEFPAQKAN
jgi:hypothetical protein